MKYNSQIYYGNSETGRVFDGTSILIPTLRGLISGKELNGKVL